MAGAALSLAGLVMLAGLGMGLPRYGAMGPNCGMDERDAGCLLGRLSSHTRCMPRVAHILLQLHAHLFARQGLAQVGHQMARHLPWTLGCRRSLDK